MTHALASSRVHDPSTKREASSFDEALSGRATIYENLFPIRGANARAAANDNSALRFAVSFLTIRRSRNEIHVDNSVASYAAAFARASRAAMK